MKSLHLFVALLLVSFGVVQSVRAEPANNSLNVAKSAARGKAANKQRMIGFDYTTDPIICSLNERVQLHGKIRFSFKKNGKNVRLNTASLESFEGVGLTTNREYVADQVIFEVTRLDSLPPFYRGFFPLDVDFIATFTIPVTGKHPTDLNSATGDPLPGKDVYFQLVYSIGWNSLTGKVTFFDPDNKGIITCH